ncbi:uncharacterized protein BXIN_0365 [Babesia sp. Xinjiang]|uniref:uncharacterized protein n=1 Tax=Babesia sp. Xinjiang TaxID=462227 RepID=UPI000A242477|nr:uncharacterized protein BXIN_0365 [Babesia sp. Xinjiang]ORM41184.1 hypothetical protein BXIN_0365 [Babesia sp. Xinjiang]
MEEQPPLYLRIAQRLRKANGDTPMSYLEFREADYKLAKERHEVVKIIGARIRDICRSELDDYVNCYTEKTWPAFTCKKEAERMKRCIRHYQNILTTPESQQQIMEERLRTGESFVVPSFLKDKMQPPEL